MTTTATPTASSPARLMELFAERVGAGDIDATLDLYDPDAVFQPDFGTTLRGHEQIGPALAEFVQLEPRISFSAPSEVITVGDTALVTNFWTMTATAPDGREVRESGVSADVARRRPDGSWRILVDQPRGEAVEA